MEGMWKVVVLWVLVNLLSLSIFQLLNDISNIITKKLELRRILKQAPACIYCKNCSDWKYDGKRFMVKCKHGCNPKATKEECSDFIGR